MKNILLTISMVTLLGSAVAVAGPEPTLPGVSSPLTSVIALPTIGGGGASAGGAPVFFTVSPSPSTGSFVFTLSPNGR